MRETIEVVSGAIDPGETPLAAARRELQEEAGYTSANWIDAGRLDPFTSLIDSPNYMFIALDIKRVEFQADEEEAVEPELVPLAEALQMAIGGTITHGASCLCSSKPTRAVQVRKSSVSQFTTRSLLRGIRPEAVTPPAGLREIAHAQSQMAVGFCGWSNGSRQRAGSCCGPACRSRSFGAIGGCWFAGAGHSYIAFGGTEQ